jgi:hypothetical protein
MLVYHRTYVSEAILADGFRDGVGTYLTADTYHGVWVSDRPLGSNEGASGDVILAIEAPEDVLSPFEWVEEGKPYREWLVPADILNRCSIVEQTPDWMPEDDCVRRGLGLSERKPGWRPGNALWPD